MKLTFKSSKLTYKALFSYSLIIIALLVVAVPVFANTHSGSNLLDFSLTAKTGRDIQSARSLTSGVNVDHLNPGQENWYTYSRDSFNDPNFSWISLAMRYESEAQIGPDEVNFQVMAQEQSNSWLQKSTAPEEVLGSGVPSPLKASNANMVEAFWTGQVNEGEVYYIRVFNSSPFGLDYVLEAKVEQPAVSGAIPASLTSALGNPATLNAQQLRWALTAQAITNMTPEEAAAWMQKAQAVGWIVTEGTAPADVPKPTAANPQLLWTLIAQAIAGRDAETATQWLIQADSLGWLSIPLNMLKNPNPVVNESGGGGNGGGSEPPAQPVQPDNVYQPINIYPNNPLVFDLKHVNSGRLGPYGEHWYSLLRDNLDKKNQIEDMKLTMFFTPRKGYISDRVNFEIFPASQYHIWARGDSDYMEHFGLGLWVSRDKDPNTGERLWSGSLVDGDRYLIKVKNGTPDVIDYYLFPGDIENAELGNPTLYESDSATGWVPYTISPATRPAPPPTQ
jgi:hypothetical protein